MSTLFMIGNGFDINCGMKTRYMDFYDVYTKQNTDLDSEVIKKFKKDISEDYGNWGDFEVAMGKYAAQFDNREDFIECIEDFSVCLKEYLRKEEKTFFKRVDKPDIFSAAIDEVRRSILKFGEHGTKNVSEKMKDRNAYNVNLLSVVSFNYTSVLDILVHKAFPNASIPLRHVHGDINSLTLGCDNDEQIKSKFAITDDLRRCFIKPFFNKEYDEERIFWTEQAIADANTICVYGMSLGASDCSWLYLLVGWLNQNENHHLFLYDYNKSKRTYKTLPSKMNDEEKAKKEQLKLWGVDNANEDILSRFHIVCGTNIFNIDQAVKKAEKQKLEEKEKKPKMVDNVS